VLNIYFVKYFPDYNIIIASFGGKKNQRKIEIKEKQYLTLPFQENFG
jgi:hypothetical protein